MTSTELSVDDLLLNTTSAAVSDSLLGLATLNPEIEIVDIGNVVMQKNLKQVDKVLVISGGASGLEPAYAHFVGTGMLAASIQGDLLQSPPCRPILQTIRELASISLRGILLIISGNSGDMLNFGLATERAKKDLIKIKMLPVLDNYTNSELSQHKKKGLSGIILVLKIAGAMAEEGLHIDKIHKFCQMTMENLISISFSTKQHVWKSNHCSCKSQDLKVGTSINGDTPAKDLKKCDVMKLTNTLIGELLYSNKKHPFLEIRTTPIILMVNNVGGISKMEEMIVLKELVGHLDDKGVIVARIYSGSYLGSMYFDGIIVSLLKVADPNILKYLDAPTSALGWRNIPEYRTDIKIVEKRPSMIRKKPKSADMPIKGPKLRDHHMVKLKNAASFACEAIISCEKQLNRIDSEFGNGNTGTRLKTAAAMFLQKFRTGRSYFHLPYHFFQYLSKLCEYQLGGPMGCIFCILFEAVASTFQPLDDIDHNLEGPIWLESLKNSLESLKNYSLAKVGDNTLLDPLEACVKGTVSNLMKMPSYLDAFGCGVETAEIITMELKKDNIYPDPGAHAMVIILRAIYEGLKQVS